MKKIGIIVAMDEEKQAVKNLMSNITVKKIYNLEFEVANIADTECILVKSGVGKVNAARTAQVLVQNFDVDSIINVGAAGGIDYSLNIGDILIAKEVVQHDFDITAFGHKKGYITGIGDSIKCDKKLLKRFDNLLKNRQIENYKIKIGVVASGDIFCSDKKMKDKINLKFNADVVDMECAAIAQVAYLDNIPFISVRCISDIPNGDNASTFDENLELASTRCAKILKEFCLINI